MKAYGGVEVQFNHSRPRHYMEVRCQLHGPVDLSPGQSLGTHWIPGNRKVDLDTMENRKFSCSFRGSNTESPARMLVTMPPTLSRLQTLMS
jgi:hypothetical protein